MKKKITIIVSVIILIGILVTLIFAMKKSDSDILKSEKAYLEMLVRNQKLDKVDKILKRTKTKEHRYQAIEKAYKNYYLDYINNIKDIQTEISKATTKYFINFSAISKGKEAQEGLKVIIDREIDIVDKITDIYKKLNEKEEMKIKESLKVENFNFHIFNFNRKEKVDVENLIYGFTQPRF